jgi:tetratricopeptide (TPR) repeat protein
VQKGHVGFFDRLRRLIPGRVPSEPFARGTHALDRGRFALAEAAFAQALAQAQQPAEVALVRNKLAIVALRRGDRELAVATLIEALEADPRSPAAITTIGNLLLEDGDAEEAVAHYEAALRIDEHYGPAHHNLGVALHRAGKRGAAVRHLRKASRLEGRK